MPPARTTFEIQCSYVIILNLFGVRMLSKEFVLRNVGEVLVKSNILQVPEMREENSIVVGLSADFLGGMRMSGRRFSRGGFSL